MRNNNVTAFFNAHATNGEGVDMLGVASCQSAGISNSFL